MRLSAYYIVVLFLLLIERLRAEDQIVYTEENQPGAQYYNGKALVIPINNDATMKLLQRWHDQAFSGLFAAFANDRIKNLSESDKDALQACSANAALPTAQAQCVVKMLNSTKRKMKYKTRKSKKQKTAVRGAKIETAKKHMKPTVDVSQMMKKKKITYFKNSKISKLNNMRKRKELKPKLRRLAKFSAKSTTEEAWVGGFRLARRRRAILQRDNYNLIAENDNRTPFGIVAKHLTSMVRAIKNKTDSTSWTSTVIQLREKAKKIRWEKEFEKKVKKKLNLDDGSSNVRRKQPQKTLTSKLAKPGRFTDHPEEDILFDKIENNENEGNQTKAQSAVEDAIKFLREGIKLSMMLTGKNVTNFDEKTLKVASPRIMPVVPEEPDPNTVSFLSPSLFGLHSEGEGVEELTSITNLLKILPNKDQEDWMNLIVEASGVSDEVKRLELLDDSKQERLKDQTGLNGRPNYFTRENVSEIFGDFETRKIDTHERLVKSFSPEQLDQLNNTGYAFMTKDQLHMFYGPTSPYNSSTTLKRLLSVEGKISNEHIEHDLRVVAEMKNFELKQKDIVLSPIIESPLIFASAAMSQPIILSPVVLSPAILSPAALGPVILSPWVFIPVILSPRILSPLIVNPLIFSPIILSPLALHPLILAPGVFNPFILSPLVLSPFILSPQVFSPLILSPFCLNPLILTPTVGGPLILSPFVLSPLIASPQALFAVVLSPYALSPLIESKLIVSVVVLSPSWLS